MSDFCCGDRVLILLPSVHVGQRGTVIRITSPVDPNVLVYLDDRGRRSTVVPTWFHRAQLQKLDVVSRIGELG